MAGICDVTVCYSCQTTIKHDGCLMTLADPYFNSSKIECLILLCKKCSFLNQSNKLHMLWELKYFFSASDHDYIKSSYLYALQHNDWSMQARYVLFKLVSFADCITNEMYIFLNLSRLRI